MSKVKIKLDSKPQDSYVEVDGERVNSVTKVIVEGVAGKAQKVLVELDPLMVEIEADAEVVSKDHLKVTVSLKPWYSMLQKNTIEVVTGAVEMGMPSRIAEEILKDTLYTALREGIEIKG
ncbi:hypothetical protein [Candidatus Formimonas warabiya]|uniref:Uncharacterized protein n=1 Tax=Formimonas warabiya TaxID=1761012 RepID=A0A3G1KNZ0_FORW1|nr:hypothetical protein [Candidatus Formimonas warabiya]ATW24167.1 hypothetical protein DCMF_04655 [Candidatus Formimonas warabiya]